MAGHTLTLAFPQAKEHLCILEYDVQTQSMVTKVAASLSNQAHRPPTEIKGCLDPECRCAVQERMFTTLNP